MSPRTDPADHPIPVIDRGESIAVALNNLTVTNHALDDANKSEYDADASHTVSTGIDVETPIDPVKQQDEIDSLEASAGWLFPKVKVRS